MYTWRKEWINKYESAWGILEKFKYANSISNNELYQLLGTPNEKGIVRKKIIESHKSYITLDGFDKDKLKNILGVNIKEINNDNIINILSLLLKNKNIRDIDIEKYFDKNIKICPVCIKDGYHSTLHQCILFDYCFIHNQRLLTLCPVCNGNNLYEFSHNYDKYGFQCSKCGNLYLEYNYIFFEKWNKEIINIKNDYAKWIYLNNKYKNKCIILYSYNLKGEKSHGKNINYNQIYEIFFCDSNNSIDIKKSYLKILSYKEISIAYKKDVDISFLDIKEQLYKSYKAIFKSISRNLFKKNRHIKANLNNTIKNKYTLHVIGGKLERDNNFNEVISTTELENYASLYAYILWRRDIEGLDSYEKVHTKNYYGNYAYTKEAFYYRSTCSELFLYIEQECYNFHKIYRYTNIPDFIHVMESAMAFMILQHYKNWVEFWKIHIKENIITKNIISGHMEEKIAYNMPNFIANYPNDKTDKKRIKFCAFLNNENYKCT